MTTMQVTGVLECPHCGAQFECTFPASLNGGSLDQKFECPDCEKMFVVSATVHATTRKVKI